MNLPCTPDELAAQHRDSAGLNELLKDPSRWHSIPLLNYTPLHKLLKQDVAQDETRIEELHKKRNFLACYCKLVVYNIIPTMRAASIFKYYVKVSVGTLENLQNRCSVNQIAQFIFILLVIYHDYLF